MAAGRSAALLARLDDAFVRCSTERRATVLREVTRLFLSQQAERSYNSGSLDEVLVCLIKRAEAAELASLSAAIATSGVMVPHAILQLALHRDAAVAAPVLGKSDELSEGELVKIAETRGQEQLLAISARPALSEPLTTALVMRGGSAVHSTLSRNPGAHFSEAGLAVLLKLAERNEELAEALGLRRDIPAASLRKFLALVAGEPRAKFLKGASPEIRATSMAPDVKAPVIDCTAAQQQVNQLAGTGQLTDSMVSRFAVGREHALIVASLALLAEVAIPRLVELYYRPGPDGIAVACRAARLRWTTSAAILANRPDLAKVSKQELEQAKGLFDTLSLSEAQRNIRFG